MTISKVYQELIELQISSCGPSTTVSRMIHDGTRSEAEKKELNKLHNKISELYSEIRDVTEYMEKKYKV